MKMFKSKAIGSLPAALAVGLAVCVSTSGAHAGGHGGGSGGSGGDKGGGFHDIRPVSTPRTDRIGAASPTSNPPHHFPPPPGYVPPPVVRDHRGEVRDHRGDTTTAAKPPVRLPTCFGANCALHGRNGGPDSRDHRAGPDRENCGAHAC